MKELLGKDMRLTNQRKLILEELKAVTSHPTADEIYGMVRQKMPRISLGTVYRNLEVLSSLGLVRKLEHAAGQKRFDADMTAHHHVRCEVCGKVGDIFDAQDISGIERNVSTDYIITGYTVEFSGICPDCRKNQSPEQ